MKSKLKVNLEKIKGLRRYKGYSCSYMATQLNFKTATGYHYIESGRCKITAEQLATISTILEVDIKDLFIDESKQVSA